MFYEKFVKIEERRGTQLYAKCPMHADTNASFTINEETGEWYCHGCSKGGKEPEFIAAYFGVGADVAHNAFRQYELKGTLPFPTEEYVASCQRALANKPRELAVLNSFGITQETIDKYRLGFDDCRITIPIYSQTGQLVNVRRYLPPHRRLEGSNNAKVLNVRGCGENRFFPYEAFEEDVIYIVEGEKDCLAARSQGINAVTGLAGTTVPMNELALFQDKVVYIMTDNDAPGRKAAKNYALGLRNIAKTIKQIQLPVKDYVDFYRECAGQDIMDFVSDDMTEQNMAPAEKVLLAHSEEVAKLNNWVVLENMSVVGTDPKTYTIPTLLRPVCKEASCQRSCPANSSTVKLEVPVDPRQLVQFIDSPDRVQDAYLAKMFGCKSIMAEPIEYTNAQKILFQESASFMDGLEDSSFEHRFGIFLYEEQRLAPTQKYNFECCRVSDPRTQQNYYVIRSATPITTTIPSMVNAELNMNYIEYFQYMSKDCNDIMELLNRHYKLWMPALNIEGRCDLFGAIVLTYLSVTEIIWRGGKLKGWLDTMVIGDTRTGKSQMAQRFVKTLKLGSYINGENARATGVIGGVQRMGDSWVITWGAIPMNDKGLLIVDEASGLSTDDIKDLSATRSSGAVTINKIAKGEARARTRLLWLSNPRSGKNLEDFYWRGYGAFLEFIPVVEDQARYDLVMTAAREDVPVLEGFEDTGELPPINLWQNLVQAAWSITPENIVYDRKIASKISQVAKELDEVYGGGPLVVGVAVHEKIIRLTCAVACLCGSMEQGKLILQEKHVEFAKQFLEMTYNKPSLDYKNYITEHKRAQQQRVENTKYVRGLVDLHPALRVLLSSNVFRGTQVREILGVDANEASKIISDLLRRGLLKVTGSGAYAPDKLLIEIAKQMEVK